MTGAHCIEDDAGQQRTPTDPEIVPDQTQHHQITNNTKNLTAQHTREDTEKLEQFVRDHSDISLDWYVPNLVNTRVKDLIGNRVQINPGENMIVFNSTELSEFFTRSCYELDLKMGRVYSRRHRNSMPMRGIRFRPTQRTFPKTHRSNRNTHRGAKKNPAGEEESTHSRNHGPGGNRGENETVLSALGVCELTRRSKISQEEAVKACKVYGPYIRDMLQQADEAMTIFVMEKELRNIEGRGNFPIPTITLRDIKIDNSQQSRKILEALDEELVRILNTVKESELAYQKGQEAARQQARAARSTHRPKYNFPSLNSSTPIKNTGMSENKQPEKTTLQPKPYTPLLTPNQTDRPHKPV